MTTLVTTIMTALHALFPGIPIADASGGMGAVADSICNSGSNANGSWLHLGNGMAIQIGVASTLLTTIMGGPIYDNHYEFTFPLAFVSIDIGGISLSAQAVSGLVWPSMVGITLSTSAFTGYMYSTAGTSTGYLYYSAIGRWK
jgi:hypothetical protein